MIKFVVIKKYSKNHVYFKNSKKKNFVELLNRYSGFEGECLCYRQTNNIEELENIINEAQKLINSLNHHECFLLLCSNIILSEQIKKKLEKKFILIGYDYGILLDEDELYSSILQEILFGNIEELKTFKNKLNEQYLFSSHEIIKSYVTMHHHLALAGKDVEIEDDMEIYELWKYKF
jgi:hypothetical protein